MNQWSVSRKIWLILAVLCAQGLLVMGLFFHQNNQQNQLVRQLIDTQVDPILLVGTTAEQIQNARIQLRDSLISRAHGKSPEDIAKYLEVIKTLAGKVDQAISTLEQGTKTPAEQEQLRKASQGWGELKGIVGQIVKASEAGDQATAYDLILTVCHVAAKGTITGLEDLAKSKKARFLEELNQAQTNSQQRAWLTVGIASLSMLVILVFGHKVIRSITGSISQVVQLSQRIARGDLREVPRSTAQDETGQLVNALADMNDALRSTVTDVKSGVDLMNRASSQLTQSGETLRQAAHKQSESATSTASAVEELNASVSSVTESAESVLETAQNGLEQTSQSSTKIEALVSDIGQVETNVNHISRSVGEFIEATQQISELSQQVGEIAEQTNLLALNAAIEAARAGEQGRGFAVVADEVRKLAEKSSQSAQLISQTTGTLNNLATVVEEAVQHGLKSINASRQQAGEAMHSMQGTRGKVSEAATGVDSIARGMREQREATALVAHTMETISAMVQQSHQAIDENHRCVQELSRVANTLQDTVKRFTVH